MFKINCIKDPVSALTHFIGLLLVIPYTIFFVRYAYLNAGLLQAVAFAVFGVALILLYASSTIYHALPVNDRVRNILRRVDHMMIFVLIAGTYTPVCLIPLRGPWGITLLILIWLIAIAGIVLKAVWLDAPRLLSTAIYVVMGWLSISAFYPLSKTVSIGGIAFLVLGGITYTVGAVIYGFKFPRFSFKWFGFHEIFHLFVMGGSLFHILFMIQILD